MRLKYRLRMICLMTATVWLTGPSAFADTVRLQLLGVDGEPLRHAVVYLPGEVAESVPASPPRAEIDQRDMQFQPHVLAVHSGTLVDFPNSDQVRHHVYSFSEAKRFELPLYRDSPGAPVEFDRPGTVILGCNIHDHMLGYVLVLDTPVFAQPDELGWVELHAIAGDRLDDLRLWHPELEQQGGTITLDRNTLEAVDTGWRVSLAIADQAPAEPAGLGSLRRRTEPRFQRHGREHHGD